MCLFYLISRSEGKGAEEREGEGERGGGRGRPAKPRMNTGESRG